ncbi:unnamed protein product [Durusdinium trenchii]|uniref:Scaffold protein Nfu/NifU N-terminal domain-containing protein n=1 Tax=Durusdinium trenchii TaxID=1381693 RepID=A0ABP0L820_9DINO
MISACLFCRSPTNACRTMLFRSAEEALAAPLAKSLLKVDGVREVLLAAEHVTVTKATLADWEELQDVVEAEISKFFEAGQAAVDPDAVETVDPQDFEEGSIEAQILELLEERVKPFVQQDGGDVEFVRFDHGDGSLYLRMVGSCSGCSQSHATLQEGVKKLMDHYLPDVKQIVGLNDELDLHLSKHKSRAHLKRTGRNCPICRAALKSIEGIRLLRVYSSDTENLEFPIPRPYRYDGVRERRRFAVPEEMRRFALHWRIHNKVSSHFNPRAAACEAAYEKLLSCSAQNPEFEATRTPDSGVLDSRELSIEIEPCFSFVMCTPK